MRPTEFESVTPAFGGQYSIQLSYGRFEREAFYPQGNRCVHAEKPIGVQRAQGIDEDIEVGNVPFERALDFPGIANEDPDDLRHRVVAPMKALQPPTDLNRRMLSPPQNARRNNYR